VVGILVGSFILITLAFLLFWFDPPISHPQTIDNGIMQQCRQIGQMLVSYAVDNGRYPDGKTSTEVFQRLLDEGYCTDKLAFYVDLPGKVRPATDKLRPENVGFDLTCCVDSSASAALPMVFLTGYKISYEPKAQAKPVNPPLWRTWSQWWNGRRTSSNPYIVVYYKNGDAHLLSASANGSIPNFIPADFDPKGKTYRQLTP